MAHLYGLRDIEFDLENDGTRCQHGLYSDGSKIPPDVRRVTEIFENPQFFKGGPNSNDIIQGALGDCWFLSALSTLTTAPEMLQKLCIAVSSSSASSQLVEDDREFTA